MTFLLLYKLIVLFRFVASIATLLYFEVTEDDDERDDNTEDEADDDIDDNDLGVPIGWGCAID